MVQYRDLNAPPSRMLADVVADMKAQERQSKTGDAGVKDLGESGDVVWPRPDGTPVSVRDVDLDLADARQRIEDAEGDLAGAQARIDTALDAEGHIREDEILRNATLLGDTVVEQINVTGKLVGTDGVFTGTVDFANVNVTGTQIVNELGANSISADKIAGGSFSGETFEGGMFVGGVFATNMRPSTDGGLSINATNGLRAWNSSGKQTVSIDPTNGDLRMGAGVYLTDPDRNGLVLNPPSSIGTASIYFTVGEDMGADSAAIWRLGYSAGKSPLMLRGGNGAGITVDGERSVFNGAMSVYGPLGVTGELMPTKTFRYPNPPSSGVSSANVYLNPNNGLMARMTSSRRYKRSITDWTPDPEAVLALQPRTWQAATPLEGTDPEAWYVGFVAEEVDELGLTELVEYDRDGQPDALHYATFSVAQQAVLQKHEAEIAELRERVALLEQN